MRIVTRCREFIVMMVTLLLDLSDIFKEETVQLKVQVW